MLLQSRRSELHPLCCSCPFQELLAEIDTQAFVISSISKQVVADAIADFRLALNAGGGTWRPCCSWLNKTK